jgi:nicotinamide-nucleotide amidase
LKAEIISVGTELLLGEITDTNATYMSQHLAAVGVDLYYRHTIGDNLDRLVGTLQTAMARSDVLILCGGLGPTADDLTRDAIAVATGRPLRRGPDAVERLKTFFQACGRTPTESNFKQCEAPEGGELIDNTCGTAPGVFVDQDGVWIFAVPGPPPEMREMMRLSVFPRLAERAAQEQGGRLFTRTLRLADIGESNVADLLCDLIDGQTDPTIALYASPAEVKVRLATKSLDEAAATRLLDAHEAVLRERLGAHVYGIDEEIMEASVGALLRDAGATLAVAESCTGGLIASRITDVPGASDYLLSGVVAYANEAKQALLGVPEQIIADHGAVSEECARAMAEGARAGAGADYAVATTGIAGPTGGTPEKPVGLVYIAVTGPSGTLCDRQLWPSTRDQFKQRVAQMALNMLRKQILADRGSA